MIALGILLAVLVLADLVALTRGLRSDPARHLPASRADWGSPSLPSGPFATL
jgi:hypothetical protein